MRLWNNCRLDLMSLMIVALTLIVLALLITVIDSEVIPGSSEALINGLIALMGAFSGAYSAFKFQEVREKKEQIDKESQAINAVLFNLHRQIEVFEAYRVKALEPHRMNAMRFINVAQDRFADLSDLRVDMGSLYFLLEHEDVVAYLYFLNKHQHRFDSVIAVADLRNKCHIEEVQPILAGEKIQGNYKLAEIEELLGPSIYQRMIAYTNDIYSMVDDSIVEAKGLIGKLCEFGDELYPGETFLSEDLLKKSINKASQNKK